MAAIGAQKQYFVLCVAWKKVEQGLICSEPPNESYSEAVVVTFDPSKIDLTTLIEVHLRTHACTSDHTMRGKYRSAIYVFNEMQCAMSKNALARLQQDFDAPIVTKIMNFSSFKNSDERFINYYSKDPSRPFCTTYIDPKLKLLREQFAQNVRLIGCRKLDNMQNSNRR